MDFSSIEAASDRIIIKNIKNFELDHVFDCGQCFRFNKEKNGNYIGVAFQKVIEVEKAGDTLIIYNVNKEEFDEVWRYYFDLDRNYSKIKDHFRTDVILKEAVEFGHGIRILQQEPFELIISFIISANKKIPMIKRSIEQICEKWGRPIKYKGKIYYAFPTKEELRKASIEELQSCAVGYRAKYIKTTVEQLCEEKIMIEEIKEKEEPDCYKMLQELCGVGPKVADCIALFSMGKYSSFPVDVWVKRAMECLYLFPELPLTKVRSMAQAKFGCYAGFAQQYLFYYVREKNIRL